MLRSSIFNQWKTVSHRRSERSGGACQVHCLSLLASFIISHCPSEHFPVIAGVLRTGLFYVLDWRCGAEVKDLGPDDQ